MRFLGKKRNDLNFITAPLVVMSGLGGGNYYNGCLWKEEICFDGPGGLNIGGEEVRRVEGACLLRKWV